MQLVNALQPIIIHTYFIAIVIIIVDYDRPDVFFSHVVLQGVVENFISYDFCDFTRPVAVDFNRTSVSLPHRKK